MSYSYAMPPTCQTCGMAQQ